MRQPPRMEKTMAKRLTLAEQGRIIEQLRLQLSVALGDVERLTRERDEARAGKVANTDARRIKVRPEPAVSDEQRAYREYRAAAREDAMRHGRSVAILGFAQWRSEQ